MKRKCFQIYVGEPDHEDGYQLIIKGAYTPQEAVIQAKAESLFKSEKDTEAITRIIELPDVIPENEMKKWIYVLPQKDYAKYQELLIRDTYIEPVFGNDEMDSVKCPACGEELARMDEIGYFGTAEQVVGTFCKNCGQRLAPKESKS